MFQYANLVIVLVVWRIAKYRQQFRSILSRSSSGLNRSRFYRLLILALILLLVYLPVTIYTLYANSLGMDRFVWSEAHGPEWGQIPKVPTGGLVGFDRWIALGTGILIFLFFGLGKDAKEMYSGWAIKLGLRRLMTRLGATKATTQPMTDTQLSLDSRVRLWHGQKSDSYPQR